MFERAVSCDCGHFRTTGNEYYPCPKCNSVCYDRKLRLKIGYFHEHYHTDRILLDFEQLYQILAEHHAVEATFAQQLYRYRVEVYENIEAADTPPPSVRKILPVAVVVRDSKSMEFKTIWRDSYKHEFRKLPGMSYEVPNVVLSMSHKDVKFVTGLNTVAMATIYETNRLFRGATVPKDATVADIVKLVEENAFRFLPKYSTLDLDRQPPMDQVMLVTDNPEILFTVNSETLSNWCTNTPMCNPDLQQLQMRWISYYSPDATSIRNPYSYAPFNSIPENGAMLSIPIKRERDRYLRKFDDDYRLFLQVIHRDMKS